MHADVETVYQPSAVDRFDHRKPSKDPAQESSSYIKGATAWHVIDTKFQNTLRQHERFWWHSSGYALAILLEKAAYSEAAQLTILDFFVRRISSRMGAAAGLGRINWKSFMTDDHTPIELSWDWGTGQKKPVIRFSFEPVGLTAGATQDPHNEIAPADFRDELSREIPAQKMQWFHHFESFFSVNDAETALQDHKSRIFWAFDLTEHNITSKAYFFPAYRATATQKTTIQVLSEAIRTAPYCTPENLRGFHMFKDYVQENKNFPPEMDMLAIDLVDPLQSRLKIYFRTRETTFASVREALTLGGRLGCQDTELGFQNMRRLWDNLFHQEGASDNSPLAEVHHRTAGILYYVDIRLGVEKPKLKIYLPVRHYAKNDWQIMHTVGDFVHCQSLQRKQASFDKQDRKPMAYHEAMCEMFESNVLCHRKGKQTYVGCSIEHGGMLRLVSYINPGVMSRG